ncbi:ATP-binding protein [Sporosarcina sp. FSL K6-1522]|uniref:ATP-binding protein n=1 Tax=Sporosarcina sp. FSL K6-1522 TaxID=2921554 RepID=UPI00315A3231
MQKKLLNLKFNKADGTMLVLTALLTAVAGEFKVIPFNGEIFRFGLGSIAYFLLILIRPPTSLIRTGLVTGITVVCFRLLGDMMLDEFHLLTSFKNHLPSFLYYFLFAAGLSMINIEKYKMFPLFLGAWGAVFEFVGNSAEFLMRDWLLHHEGLGLRDWALVGGVALFRSYFIVGLYSSITISEQKKRMQEMLSVGSELYAETLYLQKSMNHIEQITASSHDLYRKLKKQNLRDLSMQALSITQEIHEVKKDSQRILSGLSKITKEKRDDVFLLSDLLDLVMTANKKYSELLKKTITFRLSASVDFETGQHIPLLALLNNLTANAVESIADVGEIHFELHEDSEHLCIQLTDTGKGIPKGDVPIIFEPGYTTKFNDRGVAATGIGLSHVKEIIQALRGQIQIEVPEKGTIFRVRIPINTIRKRVE